MGGSSAIFQHHADKRLYNSGECKMSIDESKEVCCILEVREGLNPKVDFIYSNVIRLPAGKYYLVPLKGNKNETQMA